MNSLSRESQWISIHIGKLYGRERGEKTLDTQMINHVLAFSDCFLYILQYGAGATAHDGVFKRNMISREKQNHVHVYIDCSSAFVQHL